MAAYRRRDRGGHWYYRRWVKLPDGTRDKIGGKAPLNTKASALEAERAHVERLLNPPRVVVSMPSVKDYAEAWLAKRTNANVADDRTRLRLHALPRIGAMPMHEARPRHLRDLVLELRAEGRLAARTIRQVTGLLHTMFKSAVIEELIPSNPVVFERGVLPQKADKDPTWRQQAIYTREEAEQLISDERILPDRRVLYALKLLAALRHGEAARLEWAQYNAAAKPLGAINLGRTKSGVPRAVPVHPTLAKILAVWRLSGWRTVYGRSPTANDLIVPTRNMTDDNPRGTPRHPNESQRQLIADLELLKLRTQAGTRQRRRGHDMRRAFITLARTDGAIDSFLRWITHGPTADMLDVYSSPPWHALCAEVAKLKIAVREGQLVPMINAGASRWVKPAITMARTPSGPRQLKSAPLVLEARTYAVDLCATPTGFEPVLPA